MNRQKVTGLGAKSDPPLRSGILQRKCACGQHTGGGECEECRKKRALQRYKAGSSETADVPPIVHAVLRSPGQRLKPEIQDFMESRFGRDFSEVRAHHDAQAASSARAIDALAYTVGRNVVFGEGQYRPETPNGRRLLAHELTHVVQQGGSSATHTEGLRVESSKDLERKADAAAHSIAGDGSVAPSANAVPLSIQRQPLGGGYGSKGTLYNPWLLGPTSYAGAKEFAECIALMGEESSDYCLKETLGSPKGKWNLTQNNTDGTATTNYVSAVKIKFTPDPAQVHCNTIAFVQNVRFIEPTTKVSQDTRSNFKERLTKSGWTIDRLDQRKYGWYGYNNDGRPSGTVTPGKSPKPPAPAEMTDRPNWNVPNLEYDFETCSICKDGTEAGKVYGCLTWGFDVDGSYKLKSHPTGESLSPSAEFSESVKQWNAQAKKPVAKRNAPDQQTLGPFK